MSIEHITISEPVETSEDLRRRAELMAQYSAGASHEKLTALYVEEARRLGAAADRLANLADGDQEYPTN